MTDKKNDKKTLTDDAIKTRRGVSRRALLLGAVGGAAAATAATTASAATDSDPNDPVGRGYTGYTDTDGGANADRAGHGRRAPRRTGYTDRDSGRNADPAGNGRGRDPVDNDPTDPVDRD